MPPSVHLEAGWFPYDQLSLIKDASVPFNSYYDNHLPQAFEGRIGIGSKPDQLVRASVDLGLGYLLRETERGIEWVGPSYLRDARGSLNFELALKVPGQKKGGALFGLGGGPTLDLLTSRPYNPEFACLDVEENCQEWMEAGGVPTEDGTRIELDKAFGVGGRGYGILGVAMGPVTVLLRGGPQILYVPSIDLTESGLFIEAALRVNFGGASDPDPVLVAPAPPSAPLPPPPPARPARVEPRVEEDEEEEPEEEEESPPARTRIELVVTTAPDEPLLPVIHWELMSEATWNSFVELFTSYISGDLRSQVAAFLIAQNEPVKSMKEPILAYFDHIVRINGTYSFGLERTLTTAFTESRRQYLVDYKSKSRR